MRLLLALLVLLGASPAVLAETPTDRGVRDAFLFAYPVYQIARTRGEAVANAAKNGRTVVNRFGHRTTLAGPDNRNVTTPNNDTLYSGAWIDLTRGPVLLTMPAAPNRYHSVALMNIFTDNFAVRGTRADGGEGGSFLISGPGWNGTIPANVRHIPAPTNIVWAVVRVLVDGPDDLASARAVQAEFNLQPLNAVATAAALVAIPPRQPDPRIFLATVNAMLGHGPLPPYRDGAVRHLAPYGIRPGAGDVWESLSPQVQASWTANFTRWTDELHAGFAASGQMHEGWSYPRPGMGDFGQDDFYRAAVALGGLAALPAAEAVYFTAVTDRAGQDLDGSKSYQLRIPGNLPKTEFWSLSMYEIDNDGRLFFARNPIERYAVGDRSPGVRRDPDGGITILIQHAPPHPSRKVNWLPSPSGPFRLTFRAYLPEGDLLSDRYRLPGLIPFEKIN